MNKKIGALVLALGLVQMGGTAVAEPRQNIWTPLNKLCLLHNGTIYPTVAAPGEKKVVYGPYTGKCANSYHKFNVQAVGGLWLQVNVEKLVGGVWSTFREKVFNPTEQFGAGTYRIVFDNRGNENPVRYQGTFSVPL